MNTTLAFLAALLTPLAALHAAEQEPANRPNVIVILADDLGYTDLSCYSSFFHESPNLDRLAAQGMRFTQAYSSSPYCSPSRASRLAQGDWCEYTQAQAMTPHTRKSHL